MFDVILAPTDGSTHADRATEAAIDLAVKYSARLVVAHVTLHHLTAEEATHILEDEEIDRELRRDIDALSGLTAPIPVGGSHPHHVPSRALSRRIAEHVVDKATRAAEAAGVASVSSVIEHGSPGKRIAQIAEREKACLIVMGTRGLGGLQSVLQGSVSQSVRHACRCACLTLP